MNRVPFDILKETESEKKIWDTLYIKLPYG